MYLLYNHAESTTATTQAQRLYYIWLTECNINLTYLPNSFLAIRGWRQLDEVVDANKT